MLNCKHCKAEVKRFEVCEVETKRTICKYSEGNFTIGDRVVIKHVKRFKCENCHLTLFTNKERALKWLNQ